MTSPANLISLSEDDYLFYDDGLSEHMLQNGSEVGDPHGDSVPFVEFITEGVLLIIISILGFVGNALSIYVLLRPTLRGIFSNILMGLASFDALFLVCAITTFGLPTVSSWYKKNVFLKIMPVSYGLTHLARVGSVFATLSVTLERFFAIVFPFKDVDVVKRWLIPSTVIFTIVYNVPKFFEVNHFLTFKSQYPFKYSNNVAHIVLLIEHAFQEKKFYSQNSIQHFEFSRTFLSTGKPAILPARPLLLDCRCRKKCGKIQNLVSSSDFESFFS